MTVFTTFKKKLFFNKGINSGSKSGFCCKGRYNEKWDRILATVTAVLTFILLLSYVFINVLKEKSSENLDEGDSVVVRNNTGGSHSLRDLDNLKCEIMQYCGVTCMGFVADDNITDHINEATENVSCSALYPLTIVQSTFRENSIKEGWLQYLTIPVNYLILATSNIKEIGPKAFSGYPFNGLMILEMEDLPLHPIQNVSFSGASIETLSITYSEEHSLAIEKHAFEGIRTTLTTLNIKRCLNNSDSLLNITGVYGSLMEKLVQIDLRYNYLTNVPNNSFLYASKLTQLYLGGNQINSIERNAFQTSALFSPIKVLDLSNNNLHALDEKVFSYFANDIEVNLSNNPWNCDCSLQWLKNWYQNNSNFSDSLFCANSNDKNFNEVDFGCRYNGTSTEITHSPSTSNSGYDYIELQCMNSASTSFPEDYNDWSYFIICVRNNLMELQIYELDVESATYEVKITGKMENSYFMWYNTKNKSDYGCVNSIDDRFLMQNLEREATYTICALYGEATTSPYDCVGFVVPVDWESRTWLPNKMIKPIVGSICSVLLLEAVVVGVIVFYCIRQHPKFISGNKRVVVVSTKTTDAIIMPRSYSQSVRKENTATASTPGYLTPKCVRMNDKRKRRLRSMSESSVLSGSYINKEEIYHRRRKETTLYEMSDEEHIYESPVLPPDHPSEIRKHSYK